MSRAGPFSVPRKADVRVEVSPGQHKHTITDVVITAHHYCCCHYYCHHYYHHQYHHDDKHSTSVRNDETVASTGVIVSSNCTRRKLAKRVTFSCGSAAHVQRNRSAGCMKYKHSTPLRWR